MQIGISGRSLVHFFILELLLVGLLALIGQVPWWMWFVASALLYGALWAYDHRAMLLARLQSFSPKQIAIAGLAGALAAIVIAVAATWTLVASRQETVLPATKPPVTLDQSLLTIVTATTQRTHEPLIVTFGVSNAGKMLTTKANVSMDHAIVDKALSSEDLNKRFADFVSSRSKEKDWTLHDLTFVPGLQQMSFITIYSPLLQARCWTT